MSVDTRLSNALMTRPPDEHMGSHEELMEKCKYAMDTTRRILLQDNRQVIFRPQEDPEEPVRVSLSDDYPDVRLTNYSFNQIMARLKAQENCGINANLFRIEKTHEHATALLNLAFQKYGRDFPVALIQEADGHFVLRGWVSTSFDFVPDYDLIEKVDRWLYASGWKPALPTINTGFTGGKNILGNDKPAAWRGDRSMLAFYCPGGNFADPRSDEFGGLSRGICIGNSEVGAGRVFVVIMVLRGMCVNFLLWDCTTMAEYSAWHKGSAATTFVNVDMERILQEVVKDDTPPLQIYAAAAEAAFFGDGSPSDNNKEKSVRRAMVEFKLQKSQAEMAVEMAAQDISQTNDALDNENKNHPRLSHWSVAQGLTFAAKSTDYSDGLMDAAEKADLIIRAAPPKKLVVAASI